MRLYFCGKCGLVFFRDQERTGKCNTCGVDLRQVMMKVSLPVHTNPERYYPPEGLP